MAPHKDEYIDEGRVKADQLKHLQRKGMLTMEEWERHLSKMWDDQKRQDRNIIDEKLAS